MEREVRIQLLARVARSALTQPVPVGDASASILSLAATSYGTRPSEEATVPTGFDPIAVALFEAIVEGAYLVANADGVFDEIERKTFERVVAAACGGDVPAAQIAVLVGELEEQLREEGLEARLEALGRSILRKEHAREVLRIAALLAHATDDVSPVERDVLVKLARECGLGPVDVDAALAAIQRALLVT